MQYIGRTIEKTIIETSKHYSAVLITGPRQVGKTTTLRYLMEKDRNFVTLDDFEARKLAKTDPEMFLSKHPTPILISEVQYAPQLFSYIKIAIDNGAAPGSFWMTCSHAFHMMELAQESLAGRVAIMHMASLSQHEMYGNGEHTPFEVNVDMLKERAKVGAKANISETYERIWKGSLPGNISGKYPDRDMFYSSYLQTYVQRDIGNMVDRIDSLTFADFVRAAAFRVGQLLNIDDIAQSVGITRITAKRWLGLMEQSGVIFYLRPYSNNLLKRTIKTPKMYFFDTGLVAYLTKHSSPEALMNGAISETILENFVVTEIIKSYTNNGKQPSVYYYRDRDAKEVDMVIESDGKLHPIEVRSSASPPASDAQAFKVLDSGSVPRGTGAIICSNEELVEIDKTTLIVPIWMI